MDGRKELMAILSLHDSQSFARALLNSIKRSDLLMFRFLLEELKADVTQRIEIDDHKPTTFVLQALAVEFQRLADLIF